MTFRDQDSRLSLSYLSALKIRRQCPYDVLDGLMVFDSIDGKSIYFSSSGGFDDETGESLLYLAEANSGCPMREAFEYGEISWSDYWDSRPWVIECNWSISEDRAISAKIITPYAMNMHAKVTHQIKGLRGPLVLKRRRLEYLSTTKYPLGDRSLDDIHRELHDFLTKHGERLDKAKAKSAA